MALLGCKMNHVQIIRIYIDLKMRFNHIYLPVILVMAACCADSGMPAFAAGKTKTPLQKRDGYEFTFELPRYVERLKKELVYPLAWGNDPETDFDRWRAKARDMVRECMMTPPQPAAPEMEVVDVERRDGYEARRVRFNVNAYSRVTGYLLVPDGDGPHPAVNLLHDHGGHLFIGKEKMVRPFAEDSVVIADADEWSARLYEGQYLGDYLASHGYVVFSADAPMWGERGREEGVDRSKYDIIAGNMMMLGRNLSAFMTYDDISVTDFIASLPEVDPSRIGCAGCSMGGYRAWMLSALSDRIKAGASVCWMVTTDVQMSVKDRKKEYGGFANCIPGLRQYLDYPHIASLACPKAMLFINGRKDHLFPVDGVEEAYAIMHDVWDSRNAKNRLATEMWDIPHSCGKAVQKRLLEFFDENL